MRLRSLSLLVFAAASACTDQLPTVGGTAASRQSGVVSAPPTNPHVYLLPPLAPARPFTGIFDATLSPEVLVYAGDDVVAHFTMQGAGSDRIKLDLQNESYHVNWQPAKGSTGSRRVVVRVADQPIDYFNVDVTNRATLPIKLRIEQGALNLTVQPVGTDGGTIEAAGAELEIPAGAVSGDTPITVERSEPSATDTRVVGDVYEFGPEGVTFTVPVTITLPYDPADLPAGVSPRLLRLHTLVNGRWQVVPGSVDAENHTVSGSTTHFSTWAVLPASFASISSGEWHSCGLTSEGTAWCWGRNTEGQLGSVVTENCPITNVNTGVVTNHPCAKTAAEVQGGLLFKSIEAGNGHTCAVTLAGEAYCWGLNAWGQLGDGTTTNSTAPRHAATGYTFASVSVDHMQTCGVTTAGDVYCWGQNTDRQLGSDVTTTCLVGGANRPCSTTPVRVGIPAARVVDVGLAHACALTTANAMYCWGWNVYGQIGTGSANNTDQPPTLVPGGPYATMSTGAVHNCMTKPDGSAVCFGTDFMPNGALGDGTRTTHLTPAPVAGGMTWSQVDASNGNYVMTHTCGVASDAVAYCWGGNVDGQLGVQAAPLACASGFAFARNYDCAATPNPVSGNLRFSYVTSSAGFVCGYTITGDVYCWGKNDYGQLGNGTSISSRVPVKVSTSGFEM